MKDDIHWGIPCDTILYDGETGEEADEDEAKDKFKEAMLDGMQPVLGNLPGLQYACGTNYYIDVGLETYVEPTDERGVDASPHISIIMDSISKKDIISYAKAAFSLGLTR